jgi:hypothetical protein
LRDGPVKKRGATNDWSEKMQERCTTNDLEGRVERLEATIAALSEESRTRRLVVTDEAGKERIVGEVVGAAAELRLDLPGSQEARRTSVLVFANPGDEATALGSGVGVQLWSVGNMVHELVVWGDAEDGVL